LEILINYAVAKPEMKFQMPVLHKEATIVTEIGNMRLE